MKKILLLLFFCLASNSCFSQVFSQDYHSKKFVSTIETGWDFSTNEELSTTINVDYTLGRRVGRHWILGIGVGLETTKIKEGYWFAYEETAIASIPVFFDVKCHLTDNLVKPLFRFRIGCNPLVAKPQDSYFKSGMHLDAGVGISFSDLVFVMFNYRESSHNFDSGINRAPGFSVGLMF